MPDNSKKPISENLLEVLACPVCKSPVEIWSVNKVDSGLKCMGCARIYPIRDGIPVMLESEVLTENSESDK